MKETLKEMEFMLLSNKEALEALYSLSDEGKNEAMRVLKES